MEGRLGGPGPVRGLFSFPVARLVFSDIGRLSRGIVGKEKREDVGCPAYIHFVLTLAFGQTFNKKKT